MILHLMFVARELDVLWITACSSWSILGGFQQDRVQPSSLSRPSSMMPAFPDWQACVGTRTYLILITGWMSS